MYICKLKPTIKSYVWGGTKLRDKYGKVSNEDVLSESWELSNHKDGLSIVSNGSESGKTLKEVTELWQNSLGENCKKFAFFPILIKLIDSKSNLSVQVHPSDEYALRVEGEYGKAEVWYIVDHEEGAGIYCGFNRSITKEQYEKSINDGSIMSLLNFVKVKKGDVFFIAPGTIHAIGAGITLYELQQNSNTTYRVFDYNRLVDGKPRQLHVSKAVEVTTLLRGAFDGVTEAIAKTDGKNSSKQLCKCEYFSFSELTIFNEYFCEVDNKSFLAITIIDGEVDISCSENTVNCKLGETVFVPANIGKIKIAGLGKVLVAST